MKFILYSRAASHMFALVMAELFLFHRAALASDWPQWRGPDRNGISGERNWRTIWPADGPKVLWRSSVGVGFASVSVSQQRAYTMGNSNARDTVWCLDAVTGSEIWKHSYESELGSKYYEGGPGSTPTVDRGRVYTISKWGDAFCLDAATGKVLWRQDLRRDPGVTPNEWGFAGSPLIYGDLVVLNAGAAGVALERHSGRIAWSTGTNPAGYASPTLFRLGGKDAVLIFAAKRLVALEPKTGREFWRHPWETGYDNNNADPIISGDTIFITSYDRGAALLAVTDGRSAVVYEKKVLHTHMAPPVLVGEYLYGFNGHYARGPDFRCVHLPTGELKWTRKDLAAGSVMAAGGKLIVLDGRGQLVIAEPSPLEFKPLARAQVLGGRCWAPPALANGCLYVRNAKGDLVCLDLRD